MREPMCTGSKRRGPSDHVESALRGPRAKTTPRIMDGRDRSSIVVYTYFVYIEIRTTAGYSLQLVRVTRDRR